MRTNINIVGEEHTFNYIIDYKECNEDGLMSTQSNVMKEGSVWKKFTNNIQSDITKKSLIRIYIPDYTVSLYKNYVKYYICIKTWINGVEHKFLEYVFDENNLLACDRLYNINGLEYNEYIDLYIDNPFELMYGDSGISVRRNSGEIEGINSNGSIIYFSLQPLEELDDGNYILLDGYEGGGNSINLSTNPSQYLSLQLQYDTHFTSSITFNEVYNGDLNEYIKETYGIESEDIQIYYNFVIKDKENIYNTFYRTINALDGDKNFINSSLSCTYNPYFTNWSYWKEGLEVASIAIIKVDGEDFLTLKSQPITLTQDIFKYMMGYNFTNKFELKNINMNVWNINVTNEIKNEVIELDSPKDSKSNIVDTVFFKTHSISNILIHPDVTEFISINLDAYKARVDTFVIQIEKVKFKEYARVNGGVLFKIIGNELPNETKEGTYYILNEDGSFITSGKYKYE